MTFTSSYAQFVGGVEFLLVAETNNHIGVSRDGHVITPRHRDGTYRGSLRGSGYLGVTYENSTLYVHQMVYDLWVEPRPHDMEIDHINTDKRDNRADNLRAVTRSGNMRNPLTRSANLRQLESVRAKAHSSRTRCVEAIRNGVTVTRFASVTEAAKSCGCSRSDITRVIKGVRRKAGGFSWRYCK